MNQATQRNIAVAIICCVCLCFATAYGLVYRFASGHRPPNDPPIVSKAISGDSLGVRELLKSGTSADSRAENGKTALFWVVWLHDFPLAETLVSHGADVNAIDNYGRSMLDIATYVGDRRQIDWLLKHGGRHGPNPIHRRGQNS